MLTVSAQSPGVGKHIDITFGGRGESTVVDEVTVENLSRPESETSILTLKGNDILRLSSVQDMEDAIDDVQQEVGQPIVYPSPAYGDGTLVFDAKQDGTVNVRLLTMGGLLMSSAKFQLTKGRHTVRIPAQTAGFYAISIDGAGMKESVKWMSAGSRRSFDAMALDVVESDRELPFRAKVQTRSGDTPEVVCMAYDEGDVLRFTGRSGQMRTIVMNSPSCSHDITFDFYKCEDSDGYNYTLVRAGDLLWMAEDLRPQMESDIIYVNNRASQWVKYGADDEMQFVSKGVAYYNRKGALMALPEGWSLPTSGEVDYLIKSLGNASKVGDMLKDHSYDWEKGVPAGVDSVSFGGRPNGFVNPSGEIEHNGTIGAWWLRNTKNRGEIMTFEITDLNSEVRNEVTGKKADNFGFTVRGVRHVASPYQQMMEKFSKSESLSEAKADDRPAKAPMKYVNGPLGSYFQLSSGRSSVWYNFTGMQYHSSSIEKRSGEAYKTLDEYKWEKGSAEKLPVKDVNANGANVLRKMAAQDNEKGYQNMVYVEWSRPYHLWVGDANNVVWGNGNVNIWIYGDETAGFKEKVCEDDPVCLKDSRGRNYTFTMPSVTNIAEHRHYMMSASLSEVRYDYVMRSFNVKCIQDMTGDGIDEIVMNVGETVAIFDGAKLTLIKDIKYSTNGQNFMNHCSVRIEVADVDCDGNEDLVVLVADRSSSCTLKVYSHGDLTKPLINDITVPTYGILNDVKVGSCCGMEFPEIAVLTRAMKNNKELERHAYLSMYRLTKDASGTLGYEAVMEKRAIDGFDSEGIYGSHVGNCQLTFAYLRGREYNQDLIVADGLWRADNGASAPKYLFSPLDFTKNSLESIFADCIVASDNEGNGTETLFYYRGYNFQVDNGDFAYGVQFNELSARNTSFVNNNDRALWNTHNSTFMKYSNNGDAYKKFHIDKTDKETELMYKWTYGKNLGDEICSNPTLASVRSRERARCFEFVSYEKCYSEPRIYALLAAAPYFKGYNDPGQTTWGSSNSVDNVSLTSDVFSASAILGTSLEFSIPMLGIKVGSLEFTEKLTSEAGLSSSITSSIGYGETHAATDKDRVIMQFSPYEHYTYRVVKSDNPDEEGDLLTISMPVGRIFVGITLDDYNRLIADQKGVPHLNKLFTHTPGDPFSYPNDESLFKTNIEDGRVLWARGGGGEEGCANIGTGGSTTRTMTLANAAGHSVTASFGYEVELVATMASVKGGVGAGYNHTNEFTHTVTDTHEVTATVTNLHDFNDPSKIYEWNLCWFDYEMEKQQFPVLHYVVKKKKW